MKTAVTQHGDSVLADAAAPARATCPHCGGQVLLRRRRTMDGTIAYYWRHKNNHRIHCQGRSKPTRVSATR